MPSRGHPAHHATYCTATVALATGMYR
jgi:hypothetical protein